MKKPNGERPVIKAAKDSVALAIGTFATRLTESKASFDTASADYAKTSARLRDAQEQFDAAVLDLRTRTATPAGDAPMAKPVLAVGEKAAAKPGRYVGAEFTAADWLDANEPEIPGDLEAKLEASLAESEAADHIKLGPARYTRLTMAECAKREIPGPPKELGSVVLVVATAKVEEVLEAG